MKKKPAMGMNYSEEQKKSQEEKREKNSWKKILLIFLDVMVFCHNRH